VELKKLYSMKISTLFQRTALALALTFAGVATLAAQGPSPGGTGTASGEEKPAKGLTLNEKLEGSTSGSATVLDMNTTLGYNFNEHFGIAAGVPVYFLFPKAQKGIASNTNGLGNFYMDAHLDFDLGPVSYSSSLNAGLPTADTTKGLSTGRVMLDWDNRFDHTWGRFTPYIDIDPGNGINNLDNPYRHHVTFRRPFITLGKEVQFEGGSDVKLGGPVTLTVSGYDVTPWGPQKVYSLVLRRGQTGTGTVQHGRVFETSALTQGGADLVRDDGFNASLGFKATSHIDLSVGYGRSVRYALNNISFSVGFNLSRMFSPGPKQ
jgi:hypothetical protein